MKTSILLSGNVLSVLEGEVDAAHLHAIAPSQFTFALGAGTFSDSHCIGETLILDTIPHVSWVEKGELHTKTAPSLKSPFLLGIQVTPSEGITRYQKFLSPKTLQSLYQDLSRGFPSGFALLSCSSLESAHSTYLKKPPIFHENINENSASYWASSDPEQKKIAHTFGVVIPAAAKERFAPELLQRAFYQNPKESHLAQLQSHTHAAFLKTPPAHLPKQQKRASSCAKPQKLQGFVTS